ncbi:peptidoglycan-binding domain-containing protein [Flexivirga caeni]|uniref:Peptidoglycan-binding protein n=1 Tax=Flexivirga caeni TaxID=2294115 RepID=A0A3M9MBA9_9MICO|nr:peptidoglycan-binding protein [Flexivirga caeni]RNI22862.1 peptidoglycan-binding protein [Flexivirga caeni]
MPVQSPKRGARPAPRSVLAAARPHLTEAGAPPSYIVVPQRISMWGNDVHGDCVTAEEAFAKACHQPEVFVPDASVIAWATLHGVLEGAYLVDVLTWMQSDGFYLSPSLYGDGSHVSVDWTNPANVRSAIAQGPVKLGVAADQLDGAWQSTDGTTGWFATGFTPDSNEDHCVSLCGYGTFGWLAQQLGVSVPSNLSAGTQGYAMFTWNTIGIIDVPSMQAITAEAWLRTPTTTVRRSPNPGQPTISAGATGTAVRRLQRALHRTPNPSIVVDGVFGPGTTSAVKQFQQANGLTADGVAGPVTWAHLPDGGPMPTLLQGSSGAVVKSLQQVLTNGAPGQWGTTPHGVDGKFGPNTAASVKALQKWGGVTADGVVGDNTWDVSLHAAGADLESAVGLQYVQG